jgi:hypothetical protein
MADEAIKRRILDAKDAAKRHYQEMGYAIINSDNEVFCFSAVDKAGTHERKVRVTVDLITDCDKSLVLSMRVPPNQTKEIICRSFGSREWKKIIYDYLNNPCQ